MIKKLYNYFDGLTKIQLTIIAIIQVLLIGGFDYLSGFELSFSIFYLVPIAFISWYTGLYTTMLICIMSAATWLIVDYNSGHPYSHILIPYWNGLVRFGLFVIMARLIMIIKTRLQIEENLARHDSLTGLLNARAFHDIFSTFFDMAKRYNRFITVAYIDLDNFKIINDTLGHLEGDQVLLKIACVLNEQKRRTDFVARLGGDEFAVLLPETDISGASSAMNTMRERLLQVIDEHDWPIGISIGVACLKNTDISAEQAISRADNLMYQVKKQGKNNIIFENISER